MLITLQGKTYRIRETKDGIFFIPKAHKEIEDYMDENYDRLTGQMQWQVPANTETLREAYKDSYKGKTGYIIGKGPSLDHLTSEYIIKGSPVLAINESIHKAESVLDGENLFGIQIDAHSFVQCEPKKAKLFLGKKCRRRYPHLEDRRFVFNSMELGLMDNDPTILAAAGILDIMGVDEIIFLCCDSYIENDYSYAECVGGERESYRFKTKESMELLRKGQVKYTLPKLKGYTYKFITPSKDEPSKGETGTEEEASDKPQPQHDSQQEHRELSDSQPQESDTESSD